MGAVAAMSNVSLSATAAVSERAAPRDPAASSNFDHLEIGLGRAAVGAFPVLRHVLPACSGGNAVFRAALLFFVDIAADDAHVRLHSCLDIKLIIMMHS